VGGSSSSKRFFQHPKKQKNAFISAWPYQHPPSQSMSDPESKQLSEEAQRHLDELEEKRKSLADAGDDLAALKVMEKALIYRRKHSGLQSKSVRGVVSSVCGTPDSKHIL
jgi:hypothetical protein